MAATVWILEWAAPPGVPVPAATAHRSEADALNRIAAVAAEHGAEPIEEERPGPLRIWHAGDLVAMVRSMELLP